MSQQKNKFIQSALTSFIAAGALSSCSEKPINCTLTINHESKTMAMRQGECQSIDGNKISSLRTDQKPAALEPYSTYVRCYGVAASGKNACGTLRGACAGTVKEARIDYAWVPLPQSICEMIGGKVVIACKAK